MVIYPETDWTSYIDLADCESLITSYIFDTAAWDLLTDPEKEKYLRQASLLIKNKIIDPEEAEAPFNLALATAYLTVYSLDKVMTVDANTGNLKRISISGAVDKEYFGRGPKSNAFPSIVSELLQEFGYSNSSVKIVRS